jgi:hypothetical protein
MITLVVGAYAPELDRLYGRADVIARAVGIGLVDAAIGTTRALSEVRPDRLFFVGTAGVLPGAELAIGQVVEVSAATLGVRPGEYVPEPMSVRVGEGGRVAVSSLGITRDAVEAARLGELGTIEHLECFAVLRAAQLFGVPATAILAIANGVGPDAHAEWRANRVSAERAAQDALLQKLS